MVQNKIRMAKRANDFWQENQVKVSVLVGGLWIELTGLDYNPEEECLTGRSTDGLVRIHVADLQATKMHDQV